jgi:hypothetical protein
LKSAFVLAVLVVMTFGCTNGKSAPLPRPSPSRPSPEAVGEPGVATGGTPTACQLRLTPDRAVFDVLGAIARGGECGGPDIVLLKQVITKGHASIEIAPAATLRCEMAEAIVDWVREDLVDLASSLGSAIAKIQNLDSFECRGQNRVVGAKLSEHGRANALDVSAITLKSGQLVPLTDSAVSKDFRVAIRTSICARFTTVLGPGSDGYHEDHVHVDLAERRNGYRICQWDIQDPSSEGGDGRRSVAGTVPLPRPRPVAADDTRFDPTPVKRRPR